MSTVTLLSSFWVSFSYLGIVHHFKEKIKLTRTVQYHILLTWVESSLISQQSNEYTRHSRQDREMIHGDNLRRFDVQIEEVVETACVGGAAQQQLTQKLRKARRYMKNIHRQNNLKKLQRKKFRRNYRTRNFNEIRRQFFLKK